MQTRSHVDKCAAPTPNPPRPLVPRAPFSSEYCPQDVQQACTTTEEAKSDMDLFPHVAIGM